MTTPHFHFLLRPPNKISCPSPSPRHNPSPSSDKRGSSNTSLTIRRFDLQIKINRTCYNFCSPLKCILRSKPWVKLSTLLNDRRSYLLGRDNQRRRTTPSLERGQETECRMRNCRDPVEKVLVMDGPGCQSTKPLLIRRIVN